MGAHDMLALSPFTLDFCMTKATVLFHPVLRGIMSTGTSLLVTVLTAGEFRGSMASS
jgi:hypothetical protein